MIPPRTYRSLLCSAATTALLLALAGSAIAQSPNKFIRQGNKKYAEQQYTDAEADYKKALTKDSASATSQFNLGNALYLQQRYGEAGEAYAASAKGARSPQEQAAAYYNNGNVHMQGRKWEDAIRSYKQALLRNPRDEQARYNLAYAQAKLKKQNGGGGNSNKQNKDNKKNDKKDQQNQQNKDQQNQQNKDQQNKDQQDKDQQNKEQQNQHPQPKPSRIDKERAEQLLNAAAQAEKKLQEEKDKKKKGIPTYHGKDW